MLDVGGRVEKFVSKRGKWWQEQCNSYEKRIRELEQRLAEQHMQLQKYGSMGRRERGRREGGGGGELEVVEGRREEDGESSETSAVTGDGGGRAVGSVGVPEPMDEGMISNIQGSCSASVETRTDSMGGQRGGTKEGGDEVMSDVSGTEVVGLRLCDCCITGIVQWSVSDGGADAGSVKVLLAGLCVWDMRSQMVG